MNVLRNIRMAYSTWNLCPGQNVYIIALMALKQRIFLCQAAAKLSEPILLTMHIDNMI